MDLKETILAEHSKAQCDKIIAYIGNDKNRFARLMDLFLSSDRLVMQRAGWPVAHCVQNHPVFAEPYFGKLLKLLVRPDVHPAVARNITRLFQYTVIPKRYQGRLMDACFTFISSVETPVAIRAFSLSILEKMTIDYPEIKPELKLIVEEQWDNARPAFKSRAKKIMKEK